MAQALSDEEHKEVTHLISCGMESYQYFKYREALDFFKQALAIDNNNTQATYMIRKIEYRLSAATQSYQEAKLILSVGDWQGAANKFLFSFAMNPLTFTSASNRIEDKMLQIYLCMGNDAYRSGDFAKALECYQTALQWDPGDDYIFVVLGKMVLTCVAMEQWEKCLKYGEEAIAIDEGATACRVFHIDPDSLYSDIVISMGHAATQLGRLDDALRHYKRGFEITQNEEIKQKFREHIQQIEKR